MPIKNNSRKTKKMNLMIFNSLLVMKEKKIAVVRRKEIAVVRRKKVMKRVIKRNNRT
jgi:hypothetical protein